MCARQTRGMWLALAILGSSAVLLTGAPSRADEESGAREMKLEIRCRRDQVPAVERALEQIGLKVHERSPVEATKPPTPAHVACLSSQVLRSLVSFEERLRERGGRVSRIRLSEQAFAFTIRAPSAGTTAWAAEDLAGVESLRSWWVTPANPVWVGVPMARNGGVEQDFVLAFRPARLERGPETAPEEDGSKLLERAAFAVNMQQGTFAEPGSAAIEGAAVDLRRFEHQRATVEQLLKLLFNVSSWGRFAVLRARWDIEPKAPGKGAAAAGPCALDILSVPVAGR